jgi:cytochrome c oxidase assembly protein subunit 15
MRHQHAGLAIPDFPLAYGRVWPDLSPEAVARYNQQRIETVAQDAITSTQIALQMAHRMVALTIVCLVVWCGAAVRKALPKGHELSRLAGFWVVLIGIQFGLGAWTIWSNKAADVASMHVVCGALSLVTGGLMCVISARLREGVVLKPAENQTDLNASLMANEAGAAAK